MPQISLGKNKDGDEYIITIGDGKPNPPAKPPQKGKKITLKKKPAPTKKEKEQTLIGPYDVAVTAGTGDPGKEKNPDDGGTWHWGGNGFSIEVKSPEEGKANKDKKDLPSPSVHVGWLPKAAGLSGGDGGDDCPLTEKDQKALEKALAEAFR
jgi:hypothetical protein